MGTPTSFDNVEKNETIIYVFSYPNITSVSHLDVEDEVDNDRIP